MLSFNFSACSVTTSPSRMSSAVASDRVWYRFLNLKFSILSNISWFTEIMYRGLLVVNIITSPLYTVAQYCGDVKLQIFFKRIVDKL
jgi:hypothetical protein